MGFELAPPLCLLSLTHELGSSLFRDAHSNSVMRSGYFCSAGEAFPCPVSHFGPHLEATDVTFCERCMANGKVNLLRETSKC